MKKLWLICVFFLALKISAEDLPTPYNSVVVLPFFEHGWYSHAHFFENYIKNNAVKTVVEVGSWLGTSTRHIAKCLPEGGMVFAVDHWLGSEEHQIGQPCWISVLPKLYEQFLSNVIHEGLTAKITPIRMDSITASKILPGQVDIVYIDASHDYESVYHDLKAWFPHVKEGGILCGDDWGHAPISQAVLRFASENHLEVEVDGVYILRKKKLGFSDNVMSIQFSIPEEKIVWGIPEKDSDFAHCIPGQIETYIFRNESDYYNSYQRALYGVTKKKGGWDCLRHYEILANGCIPFFLDLDECDERTMPFLPKDLIWEAMHLPGVSYLHIDHSKFDRSKYDEILNKLLTHTRKHLTTRHMAEYLLSKSGYKGKGPILFLSQSQTADYLRCLTLIGLRQVLGSKLIDFPRINHLYKDYPTPSENYGYGMSYSVILDPDLEINRDDIEQRIRNQEFELIIYGSVHRGLPFHDVVKDSYPPKKIIYMCGDDCHACEFANTICSKDSPFFLREFTVN